MNNTKTIQFTKSELTTFITEVVMEVSSQRQLNEQFDFSWEGVRNIDDWWVDKASDAWDNIEDIVDDASNALSDFVDDANDVAKEFGEFLQDTYETVADWVSDLGSGIYNISSSAISWLKKQADSVIWYWTRGPGARFFKCLGKGFKELKNFCVRPDKYMETLEKRVSRAIAKGDDQYLDDLSLGVKCGIRMGIVAITAFTFGLFSMFGGIAAGVIGTTTLAGIVRVGWMRYIATNATKVRVGFPSDNWEYWVWEQLKDFGVVNGIFRNLEESKKWWDAYPTSPKLKHLFIGSHGIAGKIVTKDSGDVSLFSEEFLAPIKSHVNKNTKVFFTACHGADDLVALKKASEYLGCDCYGCEGVGWGGYGCEHNAYQCKAGDPLLKDMKKMPLPHDYIDELIKAKKVTPGCYPEKTDNIQSIQTFLVNKGIDIGDSGYYKNGIDGTVGNKTANGIAEYLKYPKHVNSVKSLKSYMKNDLGYKIIFKGNNPGTWGGHTNNLISYLLALQCSKTDNSPSKKKESSSSSDIALFPTNKVVKNTEGCVVVNKDNWWLNYG